jgi:Flp pilus assembly protein TadB
MRELQLAQRATVFPDTARNEAQFWRRLFSPAARLGRIHIVGIAILSAALAVALWTVRGIVTTVAGVAYLALLVVAFLFLRWRVRKALEKSAKDSAGE